MAGQVLPIGKPSGGYTRPSADDLRHFRDTDPPPPDWVIEGLEPGDVGVITAPGGLGKSMLCLSLAAAVATGTPIFGAWAVGVPGDVIYLYAEDSARTMHRRFRALAQLEPIPGSAIDRMHFYGVRSAPLKLVIRGQQGLVEPQAAVIYAVFREIQGYARPRLVLLDPMLKFHALDENNNAEMNQLMDILTQLAEQAGVAVVITHHTAKGRETATDQDAQEAARGAGAIINEARWQASLRTLRPKQIQDLHIAPEQAWRYLWLTAPKRNNTARLPDLMLERGPGGVLTRSTITLSRRSSPPRLPRQSVDDYMEGRHS